MSWLISRSTRGIPTALEEARDNGVELRFVPADVLAGMFCEIRMRVSGSAQKQNKFEKGELGMQGCREEEGILVVETRVQGHDYSFYFAYYEAADVGIGDG